MRSSIGKLTTALVERGKGEAVKAVLAEHGFDQGTVALELGWRVYGVLRGLLKEAEEI